MPVAPGDWRLPSCWPTCQQLSVERVVAAATALADAEGLEAVTMRRVAQHLGVAAMSLYTYVPGKAELLDLMLDAAYLRMARASTTGQPVLASVLDPEAYPLAVRAGSAAGTAHRAAYSPAHAYEFGLQVILDGFGVLVGDGDR